MLIPGLVSVTFRKLSPEEIIALAAKSHLKSIEWGGDIHVPPGDLARASRIRNLCNREGIAISAYGSYYHAGTRQAADPSFANILDTARELGADTIRVWAGNVPSAAATPTHRQAVVADLQNICQLSAQAQGSISLEFHGGTLTDTVQSTLQLLADVGAPNLSTYWQPPVGISRTDCLSGLGAILPHLQNIHVFHWWPDGDHRQPLAQGIDRWTEYLRLAATPGKTRHVSLEFVRNDDPGQFIQDATTLINLLDTIAPK